MSHDAFALHLFEQAAQVFRCHRNQPGNLVLLQGKPQTHFAGTAARAALNRHEMAEHVSEPMARREAAKLRELHRVIDVQISRRADDGGLPSRRGRLVNRREYSPQMIPLGDFAAPRRVALA